MENVTELQSEKIAQQKIDSYLTIGQIRRKWPSRCIIQLGRKDIRYHDEPRVEEKWICSEATALSLSKLHLYKHPF